MTSSADQPARILISETLAEPCLDWLKNRHPCVQCAHDSAELAGHLQRVQGLIVRSYTRVDTTLLERAPGLRVVGRAGVGLDNIDLEACRRRGVTVVHTPDANTQAVAEYVIGLMLDELRPRTDLPDAADARTFHALRRSEVGRQLDQLSLGVLGCGRVGSRLAAIAHAIGMRLLVCDLRPEAEIRDGLRVPFEFVSRQQLLETSEVVSIHVDGRAQNRHLLDAENLDLLRPDSLLINTSRGFVMDPLALLRWAGVHPAARVVLDVHEPEPPAVDDPLAGLPNVRRLPHLASRSATAMEAMSWVVKDVAAVLAGESPRYPA